MMYTSYLREANVDGRVVSDLGRGRQRLGCQIRLSKHILQARKHQHTSSSGTRSSMRGTVDVLVEICGNFNMTCEKMAISHRKRVRVSLLQLQSQHDSPIDGSTKPVDTNRLHAERRFVRYCTHGSKERTHCRRAVELCPSAQENWSSD